MQDSMSLLSLVADRNCKPKILFWIRIKISSGSGHKKKPWLTKNGFRSFQTLPYIRVEENKEGGHEFMAYTYIHKP